MTFYHRRIFRDSFGTACQDDEYIVPLTYFSGTLAPTVLSTAVKSGYYASECFAVTDYTIGPPFDCSGVTVSGTSYHRVWLACTTDGYLRFGVFRDVDEADCEASSGWVAQTVFDDNHVNPVLHWTTTSCDPLSLRKTVLILGLLSTDYWVYE